MLHAYLAGSSEHVFKVGEVFEKSLPTEEARKIFVLRHVSKFSVGTGLEK